MKDPGHRGQTTDDALWWLQDSPCFQRDSDDSVLPMAEHGTLDASCDLGHVDLAKEHTILSSDESPWWLATHGRPSQVEAAKILTEATEARHLEPRSQHTEICECGATMLPAPLIVTGFKNYDCPACDRVRPVPVDLLGARIRADNNDRKLRDATQDRYESEYPDPLDREAGAVDVITPPEGIR